ncbi:PREDICTED: wall-associated receptor kinase 5-like [Nelumbo nucifera]|uniref:Wall-associated receptor kinase 5-like n=1 Tax=Nelumbo nucifera TaxID=4432 RepID=A0A1U7Z6H6_NELNU|nr:PREDICTED: wall-associated receptor kinase 5-like [Nelumbo nucifera]
MKLDVTEGIRQDYNLCRYTFIADKDWHNFSGADTFSFDFYNRNDARVPTVYVWSIENESCENVTMRNATTYACGNNSDCYKSPDGIGYLCRCLKGYQGNPYLEDGCQDINECSDPTKNDCLSSTICINTPGSYNCSCPPGTEWDVRRNGGCVPLPPSQTKLRVIQVSIGIALGMVLLFASYWLYQIWKKRQIKMRKEKFIKRNGGLLLQQVSSKESIVEKIKVFTAEELAKAADRYNENRILGQGGQGTVYKGMLSDGRIVAIKKFKIVDESQLEQFINEVIVLSQINHRNVIKLLGCCLETEIPLLIYEFISGGTLYHNIHHENEDFPLSWDDRLRIATEAAGAIA